MMLFEVTNGYIASSYVHVLVIAKDKEEALEKAKIIFKLKANNGYYLREYYERLNIKCLCDDVSNGYVSEIRGG